ncbi:MFS general substrate transporter [Dichomitus squalens LYAD-421 SS1]|uniref:MFS general substrate transporter n=1 Tax=Dichomitus squalens (strain LYAD-421) TaxID=732165 RepID=R7SZP1_DICSQ|nr:MFS general substrate transporter [Dichomitus squalens LYAD-421 SS1]EJF61160.1 MFS general substrate transporter [Dichomitus squalens LYAD-421 SS1]
MTFPANVDADPDPTSQITWPARQGEHSRRGSKHNLDAPRSGSRLSVSRSRANGNGLAKPPAAEAEGSGKKRMSSLDLFNLSIAMGGSQVAWTVELGYGTPFLLELGLSEQLTSLVWLAGPISGLIAQPVIGAISDASTSKYRRRYWIVLSTAVLVFSTLTIAYCREIASFFVDMLGHYAGSWDPKYGKTVQDTAIGFAIVSFYLLDFALNALQASLRNLLLDVTPPEQLNAANAWHSRMLNAGNIVGYGFGFLPLANMPVLRLLGGSQFRKFCVVCMIILTATVWITCWTQEEKEREQRRVEKSRIREIITGIWTTIWSLPKPIRRVCYVQLFAFMGWFPFLFYSTTYIGQVMAYELGKEPDHDLATRTGAFAMLIYSLVAVAAGTLLPYLTRRDAVLLAHEGDEDEDAELTRLREQVREWRAEAARRGQPLRLPLMPFFLRNIWTGALLLFTGLTLATFFVSKIWQAIVVVSLVGICWAVACWAPFAIIMEFLKEREREAEEDGEAVARAWARRPSHSRTLSTPAIRRNSRQNADGERTPLLRRRSFDQRDADAGLPESESAAGGTILGIHNLAIVMPQFIVAIASSVIFGIVDGDANGGPEGDSALYGKNGVAWVLRFGGVCTLLGAVLARGVPPTRTEKQMRRRLAELKVLQEEGTP